MQLYADENFPLRVVSRRPRPHRASRTDFRRLRRRWRPSRSARQGL